MHLVKEKTVILVEAK